MPFDLKLIKDHPYATGGIVIVGSVVAFYLLSSNQSSSPQPSSSASPYDASALAYAAQLAQAQAGVDVQTNAQQVALQQAQLQAGVANRQVDASVETNNINTAATLAATLAQIQAQSQQNQDTLATQTIQQGNQLTYAQNIQQMQDAVLESQINAGVVENANNNATALAGTQATLDYQAYLSNLQAVVASHGIDAGLTLAQQQEADYQSNVNAIIPQAGKSYNTANDANRATTLFSQILAGGNPAPVITNQQGQTTQNVATTGAVASVLNGITKVAAGLMA